MWVGAKNALKFCTTQLTINCARNHRNAFAKHFPNVQRGVVTVCIADVNSTSARPTVIIFSEGNVEIIIVG